MEVKRGIAVSPGVAIGPALVLDTEGVRITHRTVHARPDCRRDRPSRSSRSTSPPRRPARPASASPLCTAPPSATSSPPTNRRSRIQAFRDANRGTRSGRNSYSAEYAVSRVIRDYVKRLEDAALKVPEHSASGGPPPRRRVHRHREADPGPPARPELRAAPGADRAGRRARHRPHAVGHRRLHAAHRSRLRHRERRRHAATPPSSPTRSRSPRSSALGRFLTDVSGGDTVIVDGERGRPHHRPGRSDDRALRGEAGRRSLARRPLRVAPRQARRHARRQRAIRLLGQHRTRPRSAALHRPRRRGRRPVPHRVPLPQQDRRPDRGGALRGVQDRRADARAGPPGRHPHARPGGRQVLQRFRRSAAGRRTRSSGCAASASACGNSTCSRRSCAPSCGPRRSATCASCSR